MTVVLDLNVLLDVLQDRRPHVAASSAIVGKVLERALVGFVPAHAVTTLFYVVEKHSGGVKAGEVVDWLLTRFRVIPCDGDDFKRARALRLRDFEDAVVAALAEAAGAKFIVTRNVGDFRSSPVSAVTPEELLVLLAK